MNDLASRRTLLVVVAVVAVAAIAAGVAVAAAPARKTERVAWRACMAQHGVDLQGQRPSPEAARNALETCGLPWQKQVETFVACMHAHGAAVSIVAAATGLGSGQLERAARECGLDPERIRSSVRERADRFASCMRDRGVALPTERSSLREALGALLLADRQTVSSAWQACRGEIVPTELLG